MNDLCRNLGKTWNENGPRAVVFPTATDAAENAAKVQKLKEKDMTNTLKTTASAALITLMAAAPMAAFADAPQSGSPQQSIANDPDEYAVEGNTNVLSESARNLVKEDDAEGGAVASTDHTECLNNLVKEDDGECSG